MRTVNSNPLYAHWTDSLGFDSPMPEFGYTRYGVGYVDTDALKVYHPPLQHLAPHAPTSARSTTMEGTEGTEQDSGSNTGTTEERGTVDPGRFNQAGGTHAGDIDTAASSETSDESGTAEEAPASTDHTDEGEGKE